jgi:23S rRNA (adenine2503-C2)-methyltransferase
MIRQNLKGLDREELAAVFASLQEPAFRARQLFRWIYGRGMQNFAEITDFARPLRRRLEEIATLEGLVLETRQISQRRDAEKFLFRLGDGLHIESVLMHDSAPPAKNFKKEKRDAERPSPNVPLSGRHTLCISSQVGCPVDCKFCATGLMGLLRNLRVGEIVDQVLMVKRLSGSPLTNVVVMGMGEPLLNYEALIKACYLLCDREGPNLAPRRIVISTSGLVPKIERFAREGHKFRLAISLNATTDEVRKQIMPINRKYPIAALMQAAREYTRQTKQRLTFEYILLDGVNDSPADAERLKKLTRNIPCKINLIPYNPIAEAHPGGRSQSSSGLETPPKAGLAFHRPSFERIEAFFAGMREGPNPVTLRWSKGDDIDAACGQLWTKVEKAKVLA